MQKLKKKKPLVVSFGDYAASGGYYIAMAADKIYSEPNTLTGSIGVFGVMPYYKDIANKNGIRADIVATNANSMYYSGLNGVTPYGVNMMTRSVEGTYKDLYILLPKIERKHLNRLIMLVAVEYGVVFVRKKSDW